LADSLVTFIERETVVVEGVGAVCRRALFMSDTAPTATTAMPAGVNAAAATAIDVLGDEGNDDEASKMTKSIVSFRAHHKRWRAPPSSQRVLASLAAFADHVDVDAGDDDADADTGVRGDTHLLDQQRDPFERLQTSILMPSPRKRRAVVTPRRDSNVQPAVSTAKRRIVPTSADPVDVSAALNDVVDRYFDARGQHQATPTTTAVHTTTTAGTRMPQATAVTSSLDDSERFNAGPDTRAIFNHGGVYYQRQTDD